MVRCLAIGAGAIGAAMATGVFRRPEESGLATARYKRIPEPLENDMPEGQISCGRKLMAVKDNSEEWFTQHIDKLTDDKWCIDMCQPEAEKYDPNCEDFCVGYVDYDFVACCTQNVWSDPVKCGVIHPGMDLINGNMFKQVMVPMEGGDAECCAQCRMTTGCDVWVVDRSSGQPSSWRKGVDVACKMKKRTASSEWQPGGHALLRGGEVSTVSRQAGEVRYGGGTEAAIQKMDAYPQHLKSEDQATPAHGGGAPPDSAGGGGDKPAPNAGSMGTKKGSSDK